MLVTASAGAAIPAAPVFAGRWRLRESPGVFISPLARHSGRMRKLGLGFFLCTAAALAAQTPLTVAGLPESAPLAITASYTYVRSRENVEGVANDVALTPRHSIGLVTMVENEDGRIGLEVYYTGRQRLEDNPYREMGDPYVIVGLLVERRVGRLRLFINGENLTDVRQTRWDPLLRPARALDGRWTVDGWAPVDGRVVNGGVRVQF